MTIKAEITQRRHPHCPHPEGYVWVIVVHKLPVGAPSWADVGKNERWELFPTDYAQKYCDMINAFTPDEPAGEWRVVKTMSNAKGRRWAVMQGVEVVCTCDTEQVADGLRDHNRKYAPNDVEALIEWVKAKDVPHQHWCKTIKINCSPCDCGRQAVIDNRNAIIAKLEGGAE